MIVNVDNPTLQQWSDLYEVAMVIRQIEPWNFLIETDIVTILMPECEEPVFCTAIGSNSDCYAIAVYPGYESINAFYRLIEYSDDEEEVPFVQAIEQNCLMCYFGNRDELTSDERSTLKELNIHFRGRNEWIYFRTLEPGYVPWHINTEQAALMIRALENFKNAFKRFRDEKMDIDFDGGETLLRFFSHEKECWLNTAVKMPPLPVVKQKLIIENEILIARMKKQKRSGARVEFDVTYMPTPVQERRGDRPYLPRLVLLTDRGSGRGIDQYMAHEDDIIETEIVDMFARYIERYGKPLSIHVRDDRVSNYVEDLCQKVGIELVTGNDVFATDNIIAHLFSPLE